MRVRPRADYGPVDDVAVGLVRRLEYTEPNVEGLVRVKEWTTSDRRLRFPSAIGPGTSAELAFRIDAPAEPTYYDGDRYNLRWMVFAWLHRTHQPDVVLRGELNVYSAPE